MAIFGGKKHTTQEPAVVVTTEGKLSGAQVSVLRLPTATTPPVEVQPTRRKEDKS